MAKAIFGQLTPLQRFWRLVANDRSTIVSIYIYAIFSGIISLSLPLGIQAIINLIQGGEVSTSWFILVTLVVVGIALTGGLQVMQLNLTETIQQRIFTRSAFEFGYRIPKFKFREIYTQYGPELVNRFFDTLTVQKAFSKLLLDFSIATLQILFGLILLAIYHPLFVLFGFVLILIIYLIVQLTGPKGLATSIMESKYKYETVHWLEELARTMFTFKLAGVSKLPLEKMDGLVSNYISSRKKHFRILVIQYILMIVFKVIVAAGLLVLGSLLVIEQQLNLGQFVAAEIIILMIINSVEKLILHMDTVYDMLTALEKIGNVTDLELEDDNNDLKLPTTNGNDGLAITLHDVSYTFPDQSKPLLQDINLQVEPGEKIVLSGFNGSGKSTLLHLIAGLYGEYQGTLAYNGIPLSNLNLDSLRSQIGDSLSQETLFRGTVIENISVGRPDLGFSEVQKAAQLVNLDSFIKNMPNGYQSILDPEGRKLPRSVVARFILARCIAGTPRLLLLENVLPLISPQDRQDIYQLLMKDQTWTLITISSDPELAKLADRVVLMESGKIIESGPYSSIKNQSAFKRIYRAEHIPTSHNG